MRRIIYPIAQRSQFFAVVSGGGFPDITGWVFDAAYQFSAQAVAQCRYNDDGSKFYARTNTNQSTSFTRYNVPDFSVGFVPENEPSPVNAQAFGNIGITGFDFSSDGTRVYFCRSGGNEMQEWLNTGTPYNFVSGDLTLNFTLTGVNAANDVAVRGDGSQMFYIDSSNQLVRSITMSTPDDLSTGAVDVETFDPSNEAGSKGEIDVSPNAKSMYLRASGNILYEYEFGTPGNVSTLTYTGRSLDVTGDIPVGSQVAVGVSVSADNEHMIIMSRHATDSSQNYVMHYTR